MESNLFIDSLRPEGARCPAQQPWAGTTGKEWESVIQTHQRIRAGEEGAGLAPAANPLKNSPVVTTIKGEHYANSPPPAGRAPRLSTTQRALRRAEGRPLRRFQKAAGNVRSGRGGPLRPGSSPAGG